MSRPSTAVHLLKTNVCQNLLFAKLKKINYGCIVIKDGENSWVFGNERSYLTCHIEVKSSRFYLSTVCAGSVGVAESYVRGEWTCDDLTKLIRIMARNWFVLDRVESGLTWFRKVISRTAHALQRNSLRGSIRNIASHYDLSNDFFALFLDKSMMYSCAIFDPPNCSLEEASFNKNEQICRKLMLGPGDHVLEIGTGWGGFAYHAAKYFGCSVTTSTISEKQYEFSQHFIRKSGLDDKVKVVKKDYRTLKGRFDKLVSIEMIEAVGHQYRDLFFEKCSSLLKSSGAMLLQAITVPDQDYDRSRRNVDFIKKYIFPGSCLSSVSSILDSACRVNDFRLSHFDDLTPHYATTLRKWRQRFLANEKQIRNMGFSSEFVRMWEYYFRYCEGGFQERVIGDTQMLLVKPWFQSEVPIRKNLSKLIGVS